MFCAADVKEDFAPPQSGMPGQFPVYLRLPYRRDSYFCFRQQVKQDAFLSVLSDCIRHQNQGMTLSFSPWDHHPPLTCFFSVVRFPEEKNM